MVWNVEYTDEFGDWWAILLIGGNKVGKDRWYDENIPLADKLYDDHLKLLEKEGLI